MDITHLYGLIGYPLGHSFSKGYFSEKFQQLGLEKTHAYETFPLESIEALPALLEQHQGILKGLNVTIPYKEKVLPYLNKLDPAAAQIGAVNTIKITKEGQCIGYNTDYWGFRQTLENWACFPKFKDRLALVLGNGGAAKALCLAMEHLGLRVQVVSRQGNAGHWTYAALENHLDEVGLIVNSTPLGMHPNTEQAPALPYQALSAQHFLYDIVYNPLETSFLRLGKEAGIGGTHQGLAMLHAQADRAWEIWNQI